MVSSYEGVEPYWDNTRLIFDFTSKVISIDNEWIQLSTNLFYPEGGGQPGDTGYIESDTYRVRVLDTQIRGSTGTWLKCEFPHKLTVTNTVHAVIDKIRRERITQHHSAQHLISAIFWNDYGISTTRSHITETEFQIDINKTVSIDDLSVILHKATEYILQDIPVTSKILTNEEYKLLNIRGKKINPKSGQLIRLVEIGDGIDANLCGGTHVNSTKDIITIAIKRVEGKKLRFVAGDTALFYYVNHQLLLQKVLRSFGTNDNSILSEIQKLQDSHTQLQRSVHHLQDELLQYKIDQISWQLIDDIELKVLTHIKGDRSTVSNLHLSLSENQVIIFLFTNNLLILISGSDTVAKRVMHHLQKHGVKGGGKGKFLMGKFTGSDSLEKLLSQLK